MPHKDPEARRTYERERQRKIKADPEKLAAQREKQRQYDEKRLKRDAEKRAAMYKRWYESGGKEHKRSKNGSVSWDEYVKSEEERRAKNRAYMQQWGQTEKGQRARTARSIMQRCGLSIDDYDAAYDAQNGRCLICKDEAPRYGHDRLAVDHCHKLGHFRALLCTRCNTGIGMFREDLTIMEQAMSYLRERT